MILNLIALYLNIGAVLAWFMISGIRNRKGADVNARFDELGGPFFAAPVITLFWPAIAIRRFFK